ncbi:MAG: extracellular solute-binding protein [Clostridia bacterium]|nr:extracellular solute-binding protein [Clostridia bacterium]
MVHSKATKFVAFLLAALTIFAPGTAVSAADSDDKYEASSLAELLQVSKYDEYLLEYLDIENGDKPYILTGDDIINYNSDITNVDAEILNKYADREFKSGDKTYKGLYLPADGIVGWNVPEEMKEGMYALKVKYVPINEEEAKTTAIERTFYVNEKVPFYEARFLSLSKVWVDNEESYQKDSNGNTIYRYMNDAGKVVYQYVDKDGNVLKRTVKDRELAFEKTGEKIKNASKLSKYPVFANDVDGNESKPSKEMANEVMTYVAVDSSGYHIEPLQFYFPAGNNTVQFEAQREAMVILEIELFPYDYEAETDSYDEYISYWKKKGAKDVADFFVKLQAEYPSATSDNTIYPFADRTSAVTETQSPYIQYLNAIGGDGGEKWQGVGQWARYTVNVEKDGFYEIVLRFRQSVNEGAFSTRVLRVATQSMIKNGETAKVPFDEANYLRFNFKDSWQTSVINSSKKDKKGDLITYKVYLEKGENYIEFAAGLGDIAKVLLDVTDSLNTINDIYIKFLMVTGADPDKYRDYGFYSIMPEEVDELLVQSKKLYDLADKLQNEVGSAGSYTATLRTVAQLLERMGSDESKIAANLSNLKENLGSIGTWIQNGAKQPLEVDYIVIRTPQGNKNLPKANANFWESLWFEICQFFKSFVSDYSQLGATVVSDPNNKIEVWTTLGRDQAQVLRSLINSDFAKNHTDANVDLKLVAGGALLPSVLAGVGPDVSHGHGAGDVINWAIRSAVQPLNDFEGFDELRDDFAEASWIPLTLYSLKIDEKTGKETRSETVYGLPEGLDFSMMFYRADVLNELGLAVPQTWEEVMTVMDTLTENNMQIAIPTYMGGHNLFLYQMGGSLYADDGRRINYESDTALEAFAYLMAFFTDYGQPMSYNFPNRFRTGEIPLGIVSYQTYTQLSLFATEIKGLWEFVPLPGWVTYNEDGTTSVNNVTVGGTSAIIMLADSKRSEKLTNFSWEFMKWFVSENAQADYANELTALFGSEYKYGTANKAALQSLSWTTNEYNNLMKQFNNLVGIEEYPGGYIIGRYLTFAFNDVYNNNSEPEQSLRDYVYDINAEITRKRKEFGLAVFEVSFVDSFKDK